jgi:hypothetical protein
VLDDCLAGTRDENGDLPALDCTDACRAAKERCPHEKMRNPAKITNKKAAHFDNTHVAINDLLIGIAGSYLNNVLYILSPCTDTNYTVPGRAEISVSKVPAPSA